MGGEETASTLSLSLSSPTHTLQSPAPHARWPPAGRPAAPGWPPGRRAHWRPGLLRPLGSPRWGGEGGGRPPRPPGQGGGRRRRGSARWRPGGRPVGRGVWVGRGEGRRHRRGGGVFCRPPLSKVESLPSLLPRSNRQHQRTPNLCRGLQCALCVGRAPQVTASPPSVTPRPWTARRGRPPPV